MVLERSIDFVAYRFFQTKIFAFNGSRSPDFAAQRLFVQHEDDGNEGLASRQLLAPLYRLSIGLFDGLASQSYVGAIRIIDFNRNGRDPADYFTVNVEAIQKLQTNASDSTRIEKA